MTGIEGTTMNYRFTTLREIGKEEFVSVPHSNCSDRARGWSRGAESDHGRLLGQELELNSEGSEKPWKGF